LKKQFSTFLNLNFFKKQFSNSLFLAIWFKSTLFVYKIAISKA
jgi:hypothetical protein